MKILKKIIILTSIFFLLSCAEYKVKSPSKKEKIYHSSSGFALIYDESLLTNGVLSKQLDNDQILVMHDNLKKNTFVNIYNPVNEKFVKSKVYKNTDYPKIFKIVITKKIATLLDLDENNPLVEINEIKKNKTFIAEKSNTFDEEKNVATKVPVNDIQMNDLSENDILTKKVQKKDNKYILVISDFYYLDSANNLKNDLIDKIKIDNIFVKKINEKKYRLFVGPFKNFNALKSTYISLNNLGFENLNVNKK